MDTVFCIANIYILLYIYREREKERESKNVCNNFVLFFKVLLFLYTYTVAIGI